MIGLFLGLGCGVLELFLLTKLVQGFTSGKLSWWILPAKITALALFFIPCAIWTPGQLAACGIAAASVLIIGSVVQMFGNKKNSPAETAEEEESTKQC